ncbi:T9SS type B sorting domain-containing protein [Hymenobacter coalescens]
MMLLRFGLVGLLTLLTTAAAWAQTVCPNDIPGPNACFRVYDETGQLLDVPGQTTPTVLCAGSRIRVRNCSGENIPRINIRYALNCSAASTDTVTTLTVPSTPGPMTILQSRPNPGGPGYPTGTSGLQYSRAFEVRLPPAPALQVRYCGVPFSQVFLAITNAQATTRYELQLGSGPRQLITQPAGAAYPVPAGTTTLRVFGSYTDGQACEGSTPLNLAPPTPQPLVLQRLTVLATGLEFGFANLPASPSFRYQLEQDAGSGTFQVVAEVPASTTTFTLPGGALNACYRLRLTDACGAVLSTSAALCPVDLQVSSADRQNRLTWAQAAGSAVTAFEVRRDAQLLATVPATAREYLDAAVTCGTRYRYQVVARSGAATSESATREVTTVATQAPPPPLLSASFRLDNAVEVTTQTAPSDTSSRLLVRRTLGSSTVELPFTRRRPVVDQPGPVSLSAAPCYSARLTDACGNASTEGPAACPPVLAAQLSATDDNSISLTWTPPGGQGSGWTYRLLLLDAAGQELSSSPISATAFPVLAPTPPNNRQVLRYRLEATSGAGLKVFSNVVTLTRQLVVAIPSAFTPNGDGLNDVLEIKGRFLQAFTFTLLDRTGLEVFRATDRNQTWDGRVRGVQAAPQVFPYRFEAIDETGQRIVRRGTVTLLR